MLNSIVQELAKYLNHGAFLAGVVAGVGLSIAIYLIGNFIERHWKSILLFCAVLLAISAFLFAI